MPLYEYKCHSCGKLFEVIQKFSDEPLKVHAECGGAADRQMSAPAFQLKGSGWYATDYAKTSGLSPKPGESKSDSGGSDKSSDSKSDSSSSSTDSKAAETKSESKSETKSESASPAPAATK